VLLSSNAYSRPLGIPSGIPAAVARERASVSYSGVPVPVRGRIDRTFETVAVFNADSTFSWAFSFADFIYLSLLGGMISVAWTLGAYVPEPVDEGPVMEDDAAGNFRPSA
jgi:hypothetical protein